MIFTVLVRHWNVCAEEGNGDIFCDARISESLSLNAVARKQENAGRMRQKQGEFLNNIHPLKLRLRSVLVPLAAAVLMLAVVVSSGVPMQKTLPELSKVLSVITKEYYGFAYQSGILYFRQGCMRQAEAGFHEIIKAIP